MQTVNKYLDFLTLPKNDKIRYFKPTCKSQQTYLEVVLPHFPVSLFKQVPCN